MYYAIHTEDLTKAFGNFVAVNGINFNVNLGEIFGLLGPNGAGKTATIKMLCPLLLPSRARSQMEGMKFG
jgi:ABC-2 type transport system ATP-binding protein